MKFDSLSKLLLLNAICCGVLPTTTQAERTSMVVILADDLGFGDVEYNRPLGVKGAKTPNLNAWVRSQHVLHFNNFHSPSSTCSPTRASILSGRSMPQECVIGAQGGDRNTVKNGDQYDDTHPYRNGIGSIAKSAKLAGYRTFFAGKWHIGSLTKRSPGAMGFDRWIAAPINLPSYDPGCFEKEEQCQISKCKKIPRGNPNACVRAANKNKCASRHKCYLGHIPQFPFGCSIHMFEPRAGEPPTSSKLVRVNMTAKVMNYDYLVEEFGNFVRSVPATVPFFAQLSFTEVHYPYVASPELAAQCATGKVCHGTTFNSREIDYYGIIAGMDVAVQNLRNILRDNNRQEDTIVIFTSDNGPDDPRKIGAGPPLQYRGFKGGVNEGSHRVPGVIEWPRKIHNNARVEGLASSLDLAKTFTDILVAENPTINFASLNFRPFDGVSLLPLLRGDVDAGSWKRPTPFGMCQPAQGRRRVCDTFCFSDGEWKIISFRSPRGGYSNKTMGLFNTRTDPQELRNLALTESEHFARLMKPAVDWVNAIMAEFAANCPVGGG